jgi:hypothetical protein
MRRFTGLRSFFKNNTGGNMTKMALAEALLRRKELQNKVDQLSRIKDTDMATLKVNRIKVAEGMDELKAMVPRVSMAQVTAAYDWHSKQLRLVDGAIQRANWETEISVPDSVVGEFNDRDAEKTGKEDDRF